MPCVQYEEDYEEDEEGEGGDDYDPKQDVSLLESLS